MVNHTLQFLSEGKTISIDQDSCTTRLGESVPCVDLKLCMSYSGVGVGPNAGKLLSSFAENLSSLIVIQFGF